MVRHQSCHPYGGSPEGRKTVTVKYHREGSHSWSSAVVLKTTKSERASRVRISPPPPSPRSSSASA